MSRRAVRRATREIHYRAEEGALGYVVGDILVERETGNRMLAIRTGKGVQLEPAGDARADIVDMPFDLARDVTSIRYRLHPLDVGFDVRGESMPVALDDEQELRVSYADRDGDRRVMSGPRAAVISELERLGYRIAV